MTRQEMYEQRVIAYEDAKSVVEREFRALSKTSHPDDKLLLERILWELETLQHRARKGAVA